ncbi:uncharacterized protein LOC141753822 [Sebastes fasciatus]|uniref:uncharacterized protein LOC141753822 n=1 Tax=Sebastes fasciatus TaxID=394691 RepID=UPI003D9DCED2
MKMRVNIFSCLLAFILGCNVAAEIIHEIVKEKTSVILRCPHSVEGEVTWSREINGRIVDILTADGDRDIRHNDPGRRYSSFADKSLYIHRVNISDSGRFWCNNEPAVELTVIPSGATRLDATEKTSVTMTCPHDVGGSDTVTWSSTGFRDLQNQRGFHVSVVDQTLTVTGVDLGNSGLYYCNGKPAFYLNVIKDNKTPPTTTSTSTPTTSQTSAAAATSTATTTATPTTRQAAAATSVSSTPPLTTKPLLHLVFGIVVSFLLLLVIIVVIYFTRRLKRRGRREISPVYDEIQDGSMFQPSNAGGLTAIYSLADFPAGSNNNDPTYSTIPDLLPVVKKSDTSLPNESTYSFVGSTFIGGNDKGSS